MVRSADEQREKGDRAIALTDRAYSVLVGLEDATIKEIQKNLEGSYKQLEKKLLAQYASYQDDFFADMLPSQRTLLLLQDLEELLPIVTPKKAATYQKQFEKLGKNASKVGVDLAEQIIELQEGKELSAARQSGGVPIEAIAFAARDSTKRLEKHGKDFAKKSSAIIQMGFAQNFGGQKVAQIMQQELGVTKARAETIVRTESASAMVNGQIHAYKAAGFGEYFQFICAGGSCGICGARNMQVYRVGSSQPPLHPRCRCTTMPWSREWQEAGLTNDEWGLDYVAQITPTLSTPLDEGLAPFEKTNGLVEPPTPVWTPKEARAKASAATPAKAKKEAKKSVENQVPKIEKSASSVTAADVIKTGEKVYREIIDSLGGKASGSSFLEALKARSATTQEEARSLAQKTELSEAVLGQKPEEYWRDQIADYHLFTHGKLTYAKGFDYDAPRAYAIPIFGLVNVGDGSRKAIFHEMSHILEFQYPDIERTMIEWRNNRATGPARSLRELTGSSAYEESEVALPDHFYSPYIGRVAGQSTEVLTMGLQMLSSPKNIGELLVKDKEMLLLMLGTLENLRNGEYKKTRVK